MDPRQQQVQGQTLGREEILAPTLNFISNLPKPLYRPEMGQVMTDEQVEILRRQIAVYSTITQQLAKMYNDSVKSRLTATRHRWKPSPHQLQILENLYDQGNGTPSNRSLQEITAELSAHGPIVEKNVKIWFQNRKARAKRSQQSR